MTQIEPTRQTASQPSRNRADEAKKTPSVPFDQILGAAGQTAQSPGGASSSFDASSDGVGDSTRGFDSRSESASFGIDRSSDEISRERKQENTRNNEKRTSDHQGSEQSATLGLESVARTGELASNRQDGRDAQLRVETANTTRIGQETMQKLVDSFRVGQNRSGNTEIQMDLKATVFDGMRVKVSHSDLGVEATLTVDRYAAKSALESQLSDLVQRLENQGLSVREVRVEVEETGPYYGTDGSKSGEDSEGDTNDHGGEEYGSLSRAATPSSPSPAVVDGPSVAPRSTKTDYSI